MARQTSRLILGIPALPVEFADAFAEILMVQPMARDSIGFPNLTDLSPEAARILVKSLNRGVEARGGNIRFSKSPRLILGGEFGREDILLGSYRNDSWQRYWGLIVCSSHGEAAKQFVGQAKELVAGDPEPLVMARAAQFLAILGVADPQEGFVAALAKSTDRIETNLILNMAVQIQDGGFGYTFDFSDAKIVREGRYVNARLEYLATRNE